VGSTNKDAKGDESLTKKGAVRGWPEGGGGHSRLLSLKTPLLRTPVFFRNSDTVGNN